MKYTIFNGKKNNTYYKTILNKNTLKIVNNFKVRLSSSYHLYKKDSLNFPYRLGLNTNQRKYYHISNIRAVKRIGPHNEEVLSVITRSLLGDGSSFYQKKFFSTLIKVPLNPN